MFGKKAEIEKYQNLLSQFIYAKASVEGTDIASAEARVNAMLFDEPASELIRKIVAEEAAKAEKTEQEAKDKVSGA